MLKLLNITLRRLFSRFRRKTRTRTKTTPRVLVINKFGNGKITDSFINGSALVHPNSQSDPPPIRIATFNAALFSMAPPVPVPVTVPSCFDSPTKSRNHLMRPKSILKHSPSLNLSKSKPRVSINLPDNEISLLRNRIQDPSSSSSCNSNRVNYRCGITVAEVLRELDADILALQDVKADEENEMKPLSDLALSLGMNFVFAESWAPQFGNAVLSKFPIKRSKVHQIFDHNDFRNVLKVTIDVPQVGEVNVQCTQLDHLDENWRMKQINSIIQSTNIEEEPHFLLGALNSLDPTDYSHERWTDILKYYEEMGKPAPKAEVIKLLKSMQYTDAKDFAGECESVVMIAKGQSVQGTCKYGTRVDYILASPNAGYQFVKGSYSVFSSKGTSDHHIVKVDFVKQNNTTTTAHVTQTQPKHDKVIKISASSPLHSIWKLHP